MWVIYVGAVQVFGIFTVELQTYSCLVELLYRLQQDSHHTRTHTHTHTSLMSEVRAVTFGLTGRILLSEGGVMVKQHVLFSSVLTDG